MEKKPEKISLCCMPYGDNETKGYKDNCDDCGCEVWVSDSSVETFKEKCPEVDFILNPFYTYCIKCTLKEMKAEELHGERIKMIEPGENQMNEIIDILSKPPKHE